MTPRIDFLPGSYHQRRQQHQKKLWRRALLAVCLGLIVIGSLRLKQTHSNLRAARNALQANARSMHAKLADPGHLQQQISRLEARANVVTLLRVKAAPTRVLAVVAESLPPFVTLTELRLYGEKLGSRQQLSTPPQKSAADAASQLPEEVDLARLRAAAEETALLVSLKGVAPDDLAISKLLAALHATGLFSDAQLVYTDQERFGEFALRSFAIRLTVRRPGTAATLGEAPAEVVPDRVADERTVPEPPFASEFSADASSSRFTPGTAFR